MRATSAPIVSFAASAGRRAEGPTRLTGSRIHGQGQVDHKGGREGPCVSEWDG
jgi:hypothetical protein